MSDLYYYISAEQYQPEEVVKQAVAAEKAGFDGVMVSEHFNPWVDDQAANGFTFSTLGAIAQTTDKIKLMTYVTTPLWRYPPAVVAQAAATIDRLSGGRFELGVGMGRAHDEEAAGYKYPAYQERNERMREALTIIKSLLAGDKLSYGGKYYKTKDAKLYSPPIDKVPIYLAGGAPKSSALAGEMTDGLILSVKDIDTVIEQAIKPANEAAESDVQVIASRWTIYAKDDEEAWRALGGQRGLRAPMRDTETDPAVLRQYVDKQPRDEVLSNYVVAKSMAAITDNYSQLVDKLKADKIGLQVASVNPLMTIDKLAKQVLPKLRR